MEHFHENKKTSDINSLTSKKNYGHVLWLTGISGSGKTTIATHLLKKIENKNIACQLLDGDQIRDFFCDNLGYSRSDRIANVKRIAFAAKLLADHGVFVLVANIAPYFEVRDFIRSKIPSYSQVWVNASLKTVCDRDVKGHYKAVELGEMKDLVGVDDIYEKPRNPHLTVNTEKDSVEKSVEDIMAYLEKNNYYGTNYR